MVKVELPRASWELVIEILTQHYQVNQGYVIKPLLEEVMDQVYSQEY